MSKNDYDFGLKQVDLNDYKLKGNNSSSFIILFFLSIIGYYFYDNFEYNLKNKSIELDPISENNIIVDEKVISIDTTTSFDYIDDSNLDVQDIESREIDEINYLSGKYYIIAGSFSNYNLSLNKANDLAKNSFNAIIISPINQNNMYRVAVSSYDEINNAKENLSIYKKKLNNELWILKH